MRFTSLPAVLLPIALFTIACSGDDGPPLGGDVVGSWRQLPNATDDDPPPPIAERDVFTFNADGTMAMVTPGRTQEGTYTVDGGDLVLTNVDGSETHVGSYPFRATDDRFVLGALIPAGDVEGMVGQWNGTMVNDGASRTVDVTLRADATATYAVTGTEPRTLEGTWRALGDDLEILLVPEPNFTIHLRASLVDGVLGTAYEKI